MSYLHAHYRAPLAVPCRFRNCHARIADPCTLGAAYHTERRVDLGDLSPDQKEHLLGLVDEVQQLRRRCAPPAEIAAAEQRVTDYHAEALMPAAA